MSAATQKASMASQSMNIFAAVSFYWVVSISMVFANKTLLGGSDFKSAPFFITWFQCLVTVIFCFAAGTMGVLNVPKFEVRRGIAQQILSLSVVFTCMIVFNNLCLKYVEVSFYQIARSLTIVFNVVFDYVVLGHVTSLPAMACCAAVVSGFLLGNKEEIHWSLTGVVFGVTSSFFVALNSIYVKKKFALVDNNPWKITLYNNVNAVFLFLPLIVFSGDLSTVLASPRSRTLQYWTMLTMSGLLGVMISFASAAQIKYTSPLTHNVSATAKAAFQTMLAILVYRNPITALGILSVVVVLSGSLAYTLVRRAEMKRRAAATEAAAAADLTKVGLMSSGSRDKS